MSQSNSSVILQVKKKPEMNEELKQWLQESKQENKLEQEDCVTYKIDKNRPFGKCHVCGKNEAKEICVKCGRSVCAACYFHLVGLCKKCLSKKSGEKWKGVKPNWEKALGVDWVD